MVQELATHLSAEDRLERGALGSRFRLLSILGQGGFGAVFAAYDSQLDRAVAIKVLAAKHREDAGVVSRFLAEAKTMARLRHESLAIVYDSGLAPEDGAPYIVMERLHGATLEALARPMSPERAWKLLAPIMKVLSYAHGRGVIHRDVKPENIYLDQPEGGDPVPKLLDFGIARSISGTGNQTLSGEWVGTPRYMSPEHLRSEEAAPSFDVWSIGVVFYRLITDRFPFSYDASTPWVAVMSTILDQEPTPISTHRPDLPEALASAIDRALKKDIGARYSSVEEFREAIERAFTPPQAIIAPPRPRRVGVWIAAVTLVAAIGGIAAFAVPWRSPPARGCVGDACYREGARLEDDGQARPLYQRACEGGSAAGCRMLGVFQRDGRGGLARDEGHARSLFERACEGRDAPACDTLGLVYEELHDDGRARELFERSCSGGDAIGCNDLGRFRQLGRGGLVADEDRARSLYERACEGGAFAACNNLGLMLEDDDRARDLFVRACEGGQVAGCANLGVFEEEGRGGLTPDDDRARELYQRACDGDEPLGCAQLGRFYQAGRGGVAVDLAHAAELYERGCDGQRADACTTLGFMFERGEGRQADDARARSLYERACDGGDALGCNNLGFFYENGRGAVGRDDARARSLYERSCDAGAGQGCSNLGGFYLDGRGGLDVDGARARALFGSGCTMGSTDACVRAGDAWWDGTGGAADNATASTFYRRACDEMEEGDEDRPRVCERAAPR